MPAFLDLVRQRGLSFDDLQEKLAFYNAFEAFQSHEA
jgi:hypothetical protein